MKVKIFLGENDEFNNLDLYKDEDIQLTSKLSDIEKLSNIFTDFSNSFTVPATAKNNNLFAHYYDVDIDNTFNANIRVIGFLELDTFTLRFGKIQLEQCQLKNHRPESYKITFYGGLLQISDLMGEDTLQELDYVDNDLDVPVKTYNSISQFDFEYNSSNFIKSINLPTFKDNNIITPLIAFADRDWNYGSNNSIDIAQSANAIKDTELRQAIKVIRIIEAIETKYKISFTRQFLSKAHFNNLYLWLNEGDTTILGQKTELNIINNLADSGTWSGPDIIISDFITADIANNTIDVFIPKFGTTIRPFFSVEFWVRTVLKSFLVPNTNFRVTATDLLTGEVLRVSELRTTNDTTTSSSLFLKFKQRQEDYRVKLKFDVELSNTSQFGLDIICNMNIVGGGYSSRVLITTPNTQTVNTIREMRIILPNIKVLDFFQGIMKMFKLIIRPETSNIFYLNTLDGYYADGNILDITEYVDNKEVTIERPLIYKDITFKYQKSNNVLNKKFNLLNFPNSELSYGDLQSTYKSIDTKEKLEIQLPFENMMFERLTVQTPNVKAGQDTNISIGQSISTSDNITFSKNKSKPILFYNNGIANNTDYPYFVSFANQSVSNIYNYIIGSYNDEYLEQITNSLNFNAEIDPWTQTTVFNSLYLNYWSNWINSIYSLKQRKFSFTANLPPRYVEELSLNDVLVIGNNRYRINDYTLNLTNGNVKLNLYNDIYEYTDNTQFIVSPIKIITNAGDRYYSINVQTLFAWTATKGVIADGTDWIDILTPSGFGNSSIEIRIKEKASQSAPLVFQSRFMNINITSNGVTKTVLIEQDGL